MNVPHCQKSFTTWHYVPVTRVGLIRPLFVGRVTEYLCKRKRAKAPLAALAACSSWKVSDACNSSII